MSLAAREKERKGREGLIPKDYLGERPPRRRGEEEGNGFPCLHQRHGSEKLVGKGKEANLILALYRCQGKGGRENESTLPRAGRARLKGGGGREKGCTFRIMMSESKGRGGKKQGTECCQLISVA